MHVYFNMNVHIHLNMYACVCAYMRSTTSVAGAEYPIFYITTHITQELVALLRKMTCNLRHPMSRGSFPQRSHYILY